MKKLSASSMLAFSLLVSAPLITTGTAQAHDTWILPSATILSGEKPWVTFDAAVGNDKFHFNHRPLPLNTVVITDPSGKALLPVNPFTGELRSGFDLQLTESGTYRIALVRNGVSAQWQENGKQRRWFGNAADLTANVPAQAESLKVQERTNRIETFVTKGKPTELLQVTEGLALQAQTHPNDLFSGETSAFILTLDGKPLEGATIEIVPEGSRYRNSVNEIEVKTDARGIFSVQWPAPGRYWVHAEHEGEARPNVRAADKRFAAYAATLEVLP